MDASLLHSRSACLHTAFDGGVATITLHRPEALNALDVELLRTLRTAVSAAARDPEVRAVLLTGAGRGFCSGADLAAPRRGGDAGERLRVFYHPIVLALRQMPKPVVAAVNGVAAGAGMSLALACDVVLAAESASFIASFTKIGLVPDAGSTHFLPRLVGEMRARALALLGEKISAVQAQHLGLVWKVCPDAQLAGEATQLARHLAGQPILALGLAKKLLDTSMQHDLPAQLEREARAQSRAARSDDVKEGIAAFAAKRAPRFAGR